MFIKLKTTLKLKNKFQLLKGKEKNFEEKRKQIIHKRRLFEWTLLFSPAFFKKNPLWIDSKQKLKMYCKHILSSDRTIHLLISFVSFVLRVFRPYLSLYVCVMHVCKKKINEI